MRLLEGFIFLFNIIFTALLTRGGFKKIKWAKFIPIISFAFFVFHILFEGVRWQLYPLYLITILYFIFTILDMISFLKIKNIILIPKIKKIIIAIMMFFIIISGISAYIFPVYKMPIPKGKYKIGTQSSGMSF